MATLATLFHHFMGAGSMTAAHGDALSSARQDACRLRALPNEDIYFFVKKIDNSRVVRQVDVRSRARSWRALGGASALSVLVIGLLLPSAYGLMAGYRIHSLRQERTRLLDTRSRLELQEAQLLSPERLKELARQQEFIDPSPERILYLTEQPAGALALNRQ